MFKKFYFVISIHSTSLLNSTMHSIHEVTFKYHFLMESFQ